MRLKLACVVEGHGEVSALPVLLRRILLPLAGDCSLEIPHPIRVPRSKLIRDGELERAVQLASAKVVPVGAVLVLLDADDDCPAHHAPILQARARKARSDVPVSIVLAHREFEAWFIASARSLDLLSSPAENPPADPEAIRGAKEWVTRRMPNGKYSETVDQPALAARLNLVEARRCPSFEKLCRDLDRLVAICRQLDSGLVPGGS